MAEKAEEPEIEVEDGIGPIGAAAAMAIGLRKGRTGTKPDPKLDAFLDEQTRLVRLQTEHLHEQRELQLAHLRVRRWKDRLSLALQGLGVLAGAAVLVGLGVTAWQAHQDDSLVVEPFATPPALAQQGLTGPALGAEVMDRISGIDALVKRNSISASSGVKADSGEDIKLEIPETGVSVGEIGRLLREWLGRQRRIEGDLRQTADGKLLLTARMQGRAFSASGAPAELEQLEQQVAEQIFAAADQGNYVIYLEATGRPLEAAAAAQRQAAAGVKDAFSLWATIERGLNPARALQLSRLAAQVQPRSPYSYFELARSDGAFGHDEAALADSRRLLRAMQTDRPEPLRGDGGSVVLAIGEVTIASELGDYAGAIAAAEKRGYDRLTPWPGIVGSARGHDLGQARRRLDLALSRPNPDQPSVLDARGALAAENQDWRAAAAWTAAASDLARRQHAASPDPRGLPSLAMVDAITYGPPLAEARARLGDFAGARAALEGTPGDCYPCLRERGRIAMLQGDWPEAERWFAVAIRQGPSLPFADLDRGEMLLRKGDPAAAILSLQIAHEKGRRFADPVELWGEALMLKGDPEGAIGRFAEADRYAPRWGKNHLRWGEALMLSGRYAEARRQYEIASGLDLSKPDRAALDVLLARTAKGPLHG